MSKMAADVEFQVDVKGVKEILNKIRGMSMAFPVVREKACRKTASFIVRRARELAPTLKDKEQMMTHIGPGAEPLISGWLKNSILAEKTGDGYMVGALANYAPYVEWGVDHPGVPAGTAVWFYSHEYGKPIVINTGIKPHRIAAQPFFRPAVAMAEKEHYANTSDEWIRELNRFLQGG